MSTYKDFWQERPIIYLNAKPFLQSTLLIAAVLFQIDAHLE